MAGDTAQSKSANEGTVTGVVAGYSYGLTPDAFLSLGSMEGVFEPVVSRDEAPAEKPLVKYWPGYAFAGGIAIVAYLAQVLPFAPFTVGSGDAIRHPISASIIAVIVGLLFRNLLPLPDSIKPGCKHVVKKVIPIAIVCAGAGLSLTNLRTAGVGMLFIVATAIFVALVGGYYIGRLCGLGPKTAMLIGAGTGICGNSAIVAVAPLLDAEDEDLVLSIGTVNLFGLLAMLAWPAIGSMLTITDYNFGVWAGTSIHAVPQVVAAGYAVSADAGAVATFVKLVRVTMLAPMVFILALMYAKRHKGEEGKLTTHYARLVPWFVWGFVIVAGLHTLGLIPVLDFNLSDALTAGGSTVTFPLDHGIKTLGKLLLTIAMAAIGLEVNVRQLAGVGGRAILAGFLATVLLGAVSLMMIQVVL